jgi:hypothetical protein
MVIVGDTRLTPDLVPETSWAKNLRKMIPRSEWDTIRKGVYAQQGHRCGICGKAAKLECHESWEYDDAEHVQRLGGFIALCSMCHHVKHLGMAGVLAGEGKLDMRTVIVHFIAINQCDRAAFNDCKRVAFAQWEERSRHQWRVDLGEFASLVPRP